MRFYWCMSGVPLVTIGNDSCLERRYVGFLSALNTGGRRWDIFDLFLEEKA